MKVSGFTFIRNAILFDYPVVEAITSILPVCDEFIIILGNSTDQTRQLIEQIPSPKIKIIHSTWDDSLRKGGKVLSVETNKGLDAVNPSADWIFYIQGDEVIHEQYLPAIVASMKKWKDHPEVEGLLFDYLHFYGSYDYTGDSSRWYRKEVRIVRPDPAIRSFRDAQGFQKNDRPLKVKPANATVYHYGWVKPPANQQQKQLQFNKLWHSDEWVKQNVTGADEFDYSKIDSVAKFEGAHPEVMKKRIASRNWTFSFDPAQKKLSLKSTFKHFIEKRTGWRIGEYRNYKILK